MKSLKLSGFFLLAFLFLALASPARATDPAAGDRSGLVAYWEQSLRQDAHTVRLERTDTEGVYAFETTFFPYKGKLRLINAVVSQYEKNLSSGIVEVELPDATPEFFGRHSMSYGTWVTKWNSFYYDTEKSVWFPASGWEEHFSASTGAPSGCPATAWKKYAGTAVPLAFLMLVIIAAVIVGRKQQKKAWAANDKIMERQLQALRMTEESISNQKTQIALLQRILETLQNKN